MKQFFLDLVDKGSSKSSKRFLGFYCLGLLTLAFIGLVVGLTIPEIVINILEQLVIAALITTTIDHFGNGPKQQE